MWFVLLLMMASLSEGSTALCPLQSAPPSAPAVPFEFCGQFATKACCSFGESNAIEDWHEQQFRQKYNVSRPVRVQSTLMLPSPADLTRECARQLETIGCGSSCSPESYRFIELEENGVFEAQTFYICPETCEDFFQACIDVTPGRFVNAQTFCEAQQLQNGLGLRVRDFKCFSSGRAAASPDQSFAFGPGLYGGPANQRTTFTVQAVDGFGNYKTRGGDPFRPALFDAEGRTQDIDIEDHDDGTYTVFFRPAPGTYTIDVLLNGKSIRNVPSKATFEGSALCILGREKPELPQPRPELAVCEEFAGNACCNNAELAHDWAGAFARLRLDLGGSPTCLAALHHLACGIPCSPFQSRELVLGDAGDALGNDDDDDGGKGTRIADDDDDGPGLPPLYGGAPGVTVGVIKVCREHCYRMFSQCSGAAVSGIGLLVESTYPDAESFCTAVGPPGWRVVVSDDEPNCFGSDRAVSLSGSFAEQSIGRVRVGQEIKITIQAADVSGNHILVGGAAFTAQVSGLNDEPKTTVVDNNDGTYTVSFTAEESGTYQVHVALNGVALAQSPFAAVVFPGEFDPSQTIVSGHSLGAPVRAGEKTSLFVSARDANGNDMLVGTFDFTMTVLNGPDESLNFVRHTLANATARFDFTPRTVGNYILQVLVGGQPAGEILSIEVVPADETGPFDPTRTRASGAALSDAVVGAPSSFSIVAADSNGVSLRTGGERFAVRITPASGGESVTPPVLDNKDGTYTVQFVLQGAPGPYVVDVVHVASGRRIAPTPLVVMLRETTSVLDAAGLFSASNSRALTDLLPTSVEAGMPAELQLVAYSGAGVPIECGGVSWRVTLRGPLDLDSPRTILAPVVDHLDGTYTARLIALEPGTYALDVRPQGVSTQDPAFAVPLGGRTTLSVTDSTTGAGLFDLTYTTVTGGGTTRAIEGRSSRLLVTAKDKFAVQLPVGGLSIVGTVTPVDAANPTGEATVTFVDNGDGTYAGRYELPMGAATPTQDEYTLRVLIDGVLVKESSVTALMAGTGTASPALSTVLGQGTTEAIAGRSTTVVLLLNDESGAPYLGGDVAVTGLVLLGGTVEGPATVSDRGDGSFAVRYRVAETEQYTLRVMADGVDVQGSPFVVQGVTPEDASMRQPAPLFMRIELEHMSGMDTELDRLVAMSRAGEQNELIAHVGQETAFALRALGDARADGSELGEHGAGHHVHVELRSLAHVVVCDAEDQADGTYNVHCVPAATGLYHIVVEVNGEVMTPPATLLVRVRSEPGEAELDLSASMVFGSALDGPLAVGEDAEVWVLTRDLVGKPMEFGGESFVAEFVPRVDPKATDSSAHAHVQPHTTALIDNQDGTYMAAFAPQAAVDYTVTVRHASGAVVAGTPVRIAVHPVAVEAPVRVFSPSKSTLEGDGLTVGLSGQTATVRVTTRDSLRRPMAVGGLRFAVRVNGPVDIVPRVSDNGDGSYVIEYQTPRPGRYVVSVRMPDHTPLGDAKDGHYAVDVAPWLDGEQSEVRGAEHGLARGSIAQLTLVTVDSLGRTLGAGGLWLSARLEDASGASHAAFVTDNGDGTYVLRVPVPLAVGQAQLFVEVAGAPLRRQPFAVEIVDATPVVTLPAKDYGMGVGVLLNVVEGVRTSFVMQTEAAIGGDSFEALLVANNVPGTTQAHTYPNVPVVDNGDGSYTVDVVVPHMVGDAVRWSLRVFRGDALVLERALAVTRAPLPAFDAEGATFVFGPLMHGGVAGGPVDLSVQVRGFTPKEVVATLVGAATAGKPATFYLTATDKEGVYAVRDKRLELPVGPYVMTVLVDGKHADNSPTAVTVFPPTKRAVFAPVHTTLAIEETGRMVRMITHDRTGMPLTYGGLRFGAVLRSGSMVIPVPVHDNGNGSYDLYVARARVQTGGSDDEMVVYQVGSEELVRRQALPAVTMVTGAGDGPFDCPHFWKMLSSGAAFAKPNAVTQFFLVPCGCDGERAEPNVDVTDKDALDSTFVVTVAGPSGGALPATEVSKYFELVARGEQAPFGIQQTEDNGYLVSYRGNLCSKASLVVQVMGVDIENSPNALSFGDDCQCPGLTVRSAQNGGSSYCSGHGICAAPLATPTAARVCVCEEGWSGADCAVPPPPNAAAAVLNNDGSALVIDFDRPVTYVGANADSLAQGESFPCRNVLTTSAQQLGEGSTCSFLSEQSLKVNLGVNPNVQVGQTVNVRGSALVTTGGASSDSNNADFDVVVKTPVRALVPVVSVSGPSAIGPDAECTATSGLTLRASAIGLGGRAATITWSFPTLSEDANAALREAATADGSQLVFEGALATRLRTELRRFGNTAQPVVACVTNFLGQEGCSTMNVRVQVRRGSLLDIGGPVQQRVSAGASVTLRGALTLLNGQCQPPMNATAVRVLYQWSQASGPSLDRDGVIDFNGPELRIPPGQLVPGQTYRMVLTASPLSARRGAATGTLLDSQEPSTDYVDLLVGVGSTVRAVLTPAGKSLHAREQALVFDASKSVGRGRLTYSWACWSRGDRARSCFAKNDIPENVSRFTLSPNALLPGTYTFEVTVKDGSVVSTASTEIEMVARNVPSVSITPSGGASAQRAVSGGGILVNTHEPLVLVGAAKSGSGKRLTRTEWDWQPPLKDESKLSQAGTNLLLEPGALEEGVTYTFSFEADDGEVGRSSIPVVVNEGPKGGSCVLVGADDVVAGETEVSVDCGVVPFEASPDELPLSFFVTTVDDATGRERALLVEPSTAAMMRGIVLPGGAQTLRAYAIDANGAATVIELEGGMVDVAPKAGLEDKDHPLTGALDKALTEQDWDRSVQLLNVVLEETTGAEECAALGNKLRDEFRPPKTPYSQRTRLSFVAQQARVCEPSTGLRDAHLGVIEDSGSADVVYLPLGESGESLAALTAATTGAALVSASAIGQNAVAGAAFDESLASPEAAAAISRITSALGAAQCDSLSVGAPAAIVGTRSSSFTQLVQRFMAANLPATLEHANTIVTLPMRTGALLENDGHAEVCAVYTVYKQSPFGFVGNVSSPVVSFEVLRGSTGGADTLESRKRQAVDIPRRVDLTSNVPIVIELPQDERGQLRGSELVCVAWRGAGYEADGCRSVATADNATFACACDSALGSPIATQLPAPFGLPPGLGTQSARQLPTEGADFEIPWLLLLVCAVLFCMLLVCIMWMWHAKRNNLRYEYLEMQRKKDLENDAGAMDYAGIKSEMSGEDVSLLLRPAHIEISEAFSTSQPASFSESELGGRGKNSVSSTSTSELGRTTESSGSELGASLSHDSKSRVSSRSVSVSGSKSIGASESSTPVSSSVSSTLSSSSGSGSPGSDSATSSLSEVVGEAST